MTSLIDKLKNLKVVDANEIHDNLVIQFDNGITLHIKHCTGFGNNVDFEWKNGILIEEGTGDTINE